MTRLIGWLLALLCCWYGAQPAVRTDAALTEFQYSHSGMDMSQIYCYSVRAEGGRLLADFDLYCAYEIRDVALDAEDAAALRALIDECDLWSWNGFSRSSSDVLDGEWFSLSAAFGDGTQLSASGSNAFPKGYREGAAEIRGFFEDMMEKHGVLLEAGLVFD